MLAVEKEAFSYYLASHSPPAGVLRARMMRPSRRQLGIVSFSQPSKLPRSFEVKDLERAIPETSPGLSSSKFSLGDCLGDLLPQLDHPHKGMFLRTDDVLTDGTKKQRDGHEDSCCPLPCQRIFVILSDGTALWQRPLKI